MAELTELKNVIAERTLYVMGDGNRKIQIRIGCPEVSEKDFKCSFIIEGLPDEKNVKSAYGVDSIQALALAFQKISYLLNFHNKNTFDGKLRWLDDNMSGPLFEFTFET